MLNIPGVGYRRSAMHPGTRARWPWRNGQRQVFREMPRLLHDPITKAIREVFR